MNFNTRLRHLFSLSLNILGSVGLICFFLLGFFGIFSYAYYFFMGVDLQNCSEFLYVDKFINLTFSLNILSLILYILKCYVLKWDVIEADKQYIRFCLFYFIIPFILMYIVRYFV